MANPSSPREANDTTGTKLWYGLWSNAGTATAAFLRVLNAAVVGAETTVSGALAVAAQTLHDAPDPAAEGPVKIGGYAKATAPSDVSGDADRVNAWFLRNGAQAVNVTAAGALIPGDATDGLKVQLSGGPLLADDAVFTPGTSKVLPIGLEADEGSTDSVDEGDVGAPRMTLDRKTITTPQPHTAGGLSTFNASGADGADTGVLTNTAVAVKASAGQLYGWFIYNPNDEASMVNLYDIAQGSVTVGTSTAKLQLTIPAGAAANVLGTMGIQFGTALTVSATKTAGSNTAPDVGLDVQLFYK